MISDRYSKEFALTVEDFVDCGWKEILASAEHKGYYSLHSAFNDAAKVAFDQDGTLPFETSQAKTTNLDSNGIETENSLNTLMELSKAQEIFDENLYFEIKALFCDPFGSNLRNELAHGLLGDEECQSDYAIYAWWLGMKLVFNAFWNHLRKNAENEE